MREGWLAAVMSSCSTVLLWANDTAVPDVDLEVARMVSTAPWNTLRCGAN